MAPGFTSGSPVLQLVWMRMVPMRTSLHTARSAGYMVSPARRMDTPVICSTRPGWLHGVGAATTPHWVSAVEDS